MICQDLLSAISLQELVDGALLCDSSAGQRMSLFGPAPAPVNHSAQPEKDSVQMTTDISGLSSPVSSRTASLQSSLASRLRRRLAATGSLEYDLTWKEWDMQSGPPICALRAAARKKPFYWLGRTESGRDVFTSDPRISASVCSGWPTPVAQPANGTPEQFLERKRKSVAKTGHSMGICVSDIAMVAQLAGWPTPQARDHFPAHTPEYIATKKAEGHGMANLNDVAATVAGWPSVRACEGSNPPMGKDGRHAGLTQVVVGWVTPSQRDYKDTPGMSLTGTNPDGSERTRIDQLPRQAAIAGQSSPAATGKRGVLNPDLPRWLMDYPAEWASFAVSATPSTRK